MIIRAILNRLPRRWAVVGGVAAGALLLWRFQAKVWPALAALDLDASHLALVGLFVGFLTVWRLVGFFVPNPLPEEPRGERIAHFATVALALWVALGGAPLGDLDYRLLPAGAPLAWLGVALMATGFAAALGARLWRWRRGTDGRIGAEGPVALLRHPILMGLLVGFSGFALASGKLHGLLAIALLVVAYARRANTVDRALAAT